MQRGRARAEGAIVTEEAELVGFRHEALFYAGPDGFLDEVLPFVRDGVAADEAVLVAVDAPKISRLRHALGRDAPAVQFADMGVVGRNPGRIIATWQEFVADAGGPGKPVRGVGEPISAARSATELVECHRHEALLNVAFADAPAWTLMCPYDLSTLSPDIIDEALRNHPFVVEHGRSVANPEALGLDELSRPCDRPLADVPADVDTLAFDGVDSVHTIRAFVAAHARAMGFDESRIADIVLVVHELTANTIRHAGGTGGVLRIWHDGRTLICDVHDGGRIDEPLAGRTKALPDTTHGRGLWLVNQLSDLVQVRSFARGNVVRVHFYADCD
jgi:anti-sigma regulatory factor (Ser/Thr protein kinase)